MTFGSGGGGGGVVRGVRCRKAANSAEANRLTSIPPAWICYAFCYVGLRSSRLLPHLVSGKTEALAGEHQVRLGFPIKHRLADDE